MNLATLTCQGYYKILNIGVSLLVAIFLHNFLLLTLSILCLLIFNAGWIVCRWLVGRQSQRCGRVSHYFWRYCRARRRYWTRRNCYLFVLTYLTSGSSGLYIFTRRLFSIHFLFLILFLWQLDVMEIIRLPQG